VSAEPNAPTPDPGASQLRARLSSLSRARRRSPLGLPEALALAAAAALLLAAVCAYLFLLRPQRARLASLTTEREDLQRRLQSTQGLITQNQDTQSSVRQILTSLERFEVEHLGVASGGSTGVIEELHRLLTKNNLRISGGISYTQLQQAVPGATPQRQPGQRGSEQGAQQRVVQSVFPGVGITLTVEGQYGSLRRFVRDVEASRHFIVVHTVELEGITETGSSAPPVVVADPAGDPAAPVTPATPAAPAATRGRLVSLRVDMAAFFRRAGAAAGAQ
jgi:hypothetical protein